MYFFDAPHDRTTIELMARMLDDAWAEAGFSVMGLSEDDWSEMADAISRAVAHGLRDPVRLEELALEALTARREILCRDVFAASISFDSGSALAGLHPSSEGGAQGGQVELSERRLELEPKHSVR